MAKLHLCRVCLAQNLPMYVVVNKNLQDLYEKLTDIPFVTEDSRPILACSFCCTKLKKCFRLLRKCLEAEELFAQMMNGDYQRFPFKHKDHLEFFTGLVKTPIRTMSVCDDGLSEDISEKEELPAVCERLDNIIKPKEVLQCDEIQQEILDVDCSDEEDVSLTAQDYEKSEDDVPLREPKIKESKEKEVSKLVPRGVGSNSSNVAKSPELHLRRTELEDSKLDQQTNQPSHSKTIRNIRNLATKSKGFSKKTDLSTARKHTSKKPYKCDVCQACFGFKSNLTKHTRIHMNEKPYKCEVCQRSFTQKGHLTGHMRTHTGEKPHKCDKCELCFSSKSNLKMHIRTHTGDKPFKCDVCECSFYCKSHLTKHFRIHTGEKPFKCDVCQSCFNSKSDLKKHGRVHTGEKPYKCDVCQRSFSQKAHLSSHILTHTGKKTKKCGKSKCCLKKNSD